MMSRICLLFLLGWFACITASSQLLNNPAVDRYKQWLLQHQQVSGDSITKWKNNLTSDGSWTDIDYANQYSSAWKTLEHLARVRTFAKAWADTSGGWYNDMSLLNALD